MMLPPRSSMRLPSPATAPTSPTPTTHTNANRRFITADSYRVKARCGRFASPFASAIGRGEGNRSLGHDALDPGWARRDRPALPGPAALVEWQSPIASME